MKSLDSCFFILDSRCMDWRTQRQLTILGVVFLVIVIFTGVVFYQTFRRTPTCEDKKQNQEEQGVDCGGPCVPCAFKQQKPMELVFAKAIKVREGNYDVAAEIHNPNDHLAANPIAYRIRMYDSLGAEIIRREGETYVYPDDRTYILESNFLTELPAGRIAVDFLDEKTVWTYTTEIRPDLAIVDKSFEVTTALGGEASRVRAKLINRSALGYKRIDVTAALSDEAGNVLLVAKTVVSNLQSGEARGILLDWPIKPESAVRSIDIRARANIFAPDNAIPF